MGAGRTWTEAEKDYLAENWGVLSVPTLCKNLNRSENAIIVMKDRMHLGAFYDAGDYVTMHQLCLAIGYTGGDGYKKKSWIKNRDFPVKYKRMKEKKVKVVYIEDFWKWAEQNQSFLDFSKFEENALGLEPEWAKRKRKQDLKIVRCLKKTPWTPLEDDYLKGLLKQQRYSYAELSAKLQRTEGAIQRRINDLKLKERPVKADVHNPWTDEQIALLGALIKKGYSYEAIHEQIPDKSTKAIRGYVFRLYLTESLDKVRRSIGEGEFGDNLPERKLYQRNCMTVEERIEVKENVSQLAYLLNQRARQISPVSEEFKDYWQKDMCMNWDDILGCRAGEKSCDSCSSFQRIQPQNCVRCGAVFFCRKEANVCEPCRIARKKQAQRKWAIMNKKKGSRAS